MSCGVRECPSCNASIDYVDPEGQPINRARLKSLGPRRSKFEQLAVDLDLPENVNAITDEQLVAFVNRNDLLSEALIGEVRRILDELDLHSPSAIRSSRTRRAFDDLLKHMQALHATYDELCEVEPAGLLRDFRLYLLSIYRALLDLDVWLARSALAITLEEIQAGQRGIQAALDRAAEAARQGADELDAIDPDLLPASITDRLVAFAGKAGEHEHAGRPDFASVLASELEGAGWIAGLSHLGQVGAAYFGRTLAISPNELPPEQGFALFVTAAEIAASHDPLTLRRRTGVYLDILEQAFGADPAAVTVVIGAAEDDLAEAFVALLSVGDKFHALHDVALPREAMRLDLVSSYIPMAEWVFGRLVSVLLSARNILKGQNTPYEDVRSMLLGAKVNELQQDSDPRYAAALLGIATIARNAGAHGGVELSGNRIKLIQRDRTGQETSEEISDEDFEARFVDLILTCQALCIAVTLLRVLHHNVLPPPDLSDYPRLLSEAGRALIGLGGLRQGTVQIIDSESLVQVNGLRDADEPVTDPTSAYLSTAFTIAILFRRWDTVRLVVHDAEDNEVCSLTVPTAMATMYEQLPEEGRPYGVLLVAAKTEVIPTTLDEIERYERFLIAMPAWLILQDVAALAPIRQSLPERSSEYRRGLEELLAKLKIHRRILREVDAPPGTLATQKRMFEGIRRLRRGLEAHLSATRRERWTVITKASPDIEQAGDMLLEFAGRLATPTEADQPKPDRTPSAESPTL